MTATTDAFAAGRREVRFAGLGASEQGFCPCPQGRCSHFLQNAGAFLCPAQHKQDTCPSVLSGCVVLCLRRCSALQERQVKDVLVDCYVGAALDGIQSGDVNCDDVTQNSALGCDHAGLIPDGDYAAAAQRSAPA